MINGNTPIEVRRTTDLKPHPANEKIYEPLDDTSFDESIRTKGVLTPLLITFTSATASWLTPTSTLKLLPMAFRLMPSSMKALVLRRLPWLPFGVSQCRKKARVHQPSCGFDLIAY